jgi:hypothetical protein
MLSREDAEIILQQFGFEINSTDIFFIEGAIASSSLLYIGEITPVGNAFIELKLNGNSVYVAGQAPLWGNGYTYPVIFDEIDLSSWDSPAHNFNGWACRKSNY